MRGNFNRYEGERELDLAKGHFKSLLLDPKMKERDERYRREDAILQRKWRERHDRNRASAIRATGKPKFNLNYHLIKAELKYNIQFDRSSLSQSELASWVAYNPKDIEDLFEHKDIMMAYHRSGSSLGEAPLAFYHLDDSMSDKEIKVKFHFLP